MRRRAILWCGLAAVSTAAHVLMPRLLRFDPVDATVTRGFYGDSSTSSDAAIDLEYTVGSVSYEKTSVRVPSSMYMSWRGGLGSSLPIFCNHWIPHWWRWEEFPSDVIEGCNAFLVLSVVFVLLLIRDLGRAPSGRSLPSRNNQAASREAD